MTKSSHDPPSESPEDLFDDFIDQLETEESVEFEDFVRQYPDYRDALTEQWEAYQRATNGLHSNKKVSRAPYSPTRDWTASLEASNHYQILDHIASGGTSEVYRVWDERLKRNLAMKVLMPQASQGESSSKRFRRLARFVEEAQVSGQLQHPTILPIHDVGIDDEQRPFFTMPIVEGMTLRDVIKSIHGQHEDWTLTRGISILVKVCEALAYAHEKGVVHRDIKPGNIMIGRYGEAYIMDWGFAKVIGHRDWMTRPFVSPESTAEFSTVRQDIANEVPHSPLMTIEGDVIGTPAYMSPEQARGELEKVGPRSDVFSVGAVLYHLLSGKTPYLDEGTKSPQDVVNQVATSAPTPIAKVAPKAPYELVSICEKAMERNPEFRYAHIDEFARDLRAFLDQRVVSAYQSGPFAELKKWISRNKAIALSAAVALIATVGALIFVMQTNRELWKAQSQVAESLGTVRRTDYWKGIALASSHVQHGDTAAALEALSECDPQLRSWEWKYLNWAADESVHSLENFNIHDIDVSCTGLVAVALRSGHVVLWKAGSKEPKVTLSGPKKLVDRVRFSSDGELVAAGSGDGTVTVWETKTGERKWSLKGLGGRIEGLAFFGNHLTAVEMSRGLVCWDIETGELIRRHKNSRGHRFCISPDGAYFALWSGHGGNIGKPQSASIVDAKTLEPLHQFKTYYPYVDFDPKEPRVFFSGDNETIRAIDLNSGRETGFEIPGSVFAISLDGERMATASSRNQSIGIWDLESGEPSWEMLGHSGRITNLKFFPDGTKLASTTWSVTKIWDLEKAHPRQVISVAREGLSSVCFAQDSTRIATGSDKGVVQVWEVPSLEPVATLRTKVRTLTALEFFPDGNLIACAGVQQAAEVWDISRQECVEHIGTRGNSSKLDLSIINGGEYLVIAGSKIGGTYGWNPPWDGTRWELPLEYPANCVAAGDNNTIWLGDIAGRVFAYDLANEKTSSSVYTPHPGHSVLALTLSPDRSLIASLATGGSIVLTETASGKRYGEFRGHGATRFHGDIAFSSDSTRFLSTGDDGVVRMRELENGLVVLTLTGDGKKLKNLAVSPDGKRIAAVGLSGKLFLWNMPEEE